LGERMGMGEKGGEGEEWGRRGSPTDLVGTDKSNDFDHFAK